MTVPGAPAQSQVSHGEADQLIAAPDEEFVKEFGLEEFLASAKGEEAAAADESEWTEVDGDEAESDEAEASEDAAAEELADDEASEDAEEQDESEDESDAGEETETDEVAEKPATKFEILGADGKPVELPKGLTLKFKGDGKERNLTLDRVVRLAQTGAYNERLQQEVATVRTELPKYQEYIQKLEDYATQVENDRLRLLTDDDHLIKSREDYERQNTPEARAKRAEAELASERSRGAQRDYSTKLTTFTSQRVEPVFTAVLKQFPTISPEEVFGRFSLLTAPLLVNGRVPESRFTQVEQLLSQDLLPWAEQVHARRSESSASERTKAAAEVKKAKEQVHAAKRQVARAVKPAGKSGGKGGSKAKPKPIRTMDEGVDSIISEVGDLFREAS